MSNLAHQSITQFLYYIIFIYVYFSFSFYVLPNILQFLHNPTSLPFIFYNLFLLLLRYTILRLSALPTYNLTHWRGRDGPTRGWGSMESHLPEEGVRAGISSIEILTEGRRLVPAQSLKLGNTGFARSLADKRRLSHWPTDIA